MKPRNVINPEAVEKLFKRISSGRPKHVRDWFLSTARRWYLQYGPARLLVPKNSPLLPALQQINRSMKGKVMKDSMPKLLLDICEPPSWYDPSSLDILYQMKIPPIEGTLMQRFNHWADYLCTLPEKQLTLTPWHLVDAVFAWDKQMLRRKLTASLTKGVELHHLHCLQGTDYYLVRLREYEAFKAEGQTMKHCIGNSMHYFTKKHGEFYSLRTYEQDASSVVTFEISTAATIHGNQVGNVLQLKGKCNQRPIDSVLALCKLVAREMRWDMSMIKSSHWDGWGDGDEDEEDEVRHEESAYGPDVFKLGDFVVTRFNIGTQKNPKYITETDSY